MVRADIINITSYHPDSRFVPVNGDANPLDIVIPYL
jgi:hypothetical protein